MKIKKFAVVGVALLAFVVNASPVLSAQAHTVEPAIPTYGLYCKNSDLIKSGSANFDFTNDELFSEGKCIKQSEYHVVATNGEVEFAIPFVSSAMNSPDIVVNVNGQRVVGTVWYGYSGFWSEYAFDIEKTYSPILDESIIGTLYTFIPDSDTVTVSLKLNEWKSYIYETTNHYSSSNSADGSHTWTLKNASSEHKYSFFIFGDSTECTFETSCGYEMQTITCKEFIDTQYEIFEEYYDHNGGVPIELFYSAVNRVIQEKTIISHNELFLRGVWSNWKYSGKDHWSLSQYEAISTLRDLAKALDYIADPVYSNIDTHHNLENQIKINFDMGNASNIETKYFILTFYKKGTCHIVFKDDELLEKFNLYVGRQRDWLPPCYGRKAYKDLDEEELAVADSFSGGEEGYNEIYENPTKYLVDSSQMLLLTEGTSV